MIHSKIMKVPCPLCAKELRGFVVRCERLRDYFMLEFESDCVCEFDAVQGHWQIQEQMMEKGKVSLIEVEKNLPFLQRLVFLVKMAWYKHITQEVWRIRNERKRIAEAVKQIEDSIAREKREDMVKSIFSQKS